MVERLLILAMLWIVAVDSKDVRRKRVINGVVITDRRHPTYKAIQYFVWIGFGRDFIDWLVLYNAWRGERRVCGGALLTTMVVQSACHCFADYEYDDRDDLEWHRGVRNEHTMQIVVGHSEVIPNVRPQSISEYIIHPHCGALRGGLLVYDLALLVLSNEVELLGTISVAPVYPLADMAAMYKHVLTHQSVCLLIGFGRNVSRENETVPLELRHGWQSSMSYQGCYSQVYSQSMFKPNPMSEYQKIDTNSCLEPFKDLRLSSLNSKGDSGSPVTCDNIYFGVMSQYFGTISGITDVIFDAFANSAEYRDEFLLAISDSYYSAHKNHSWPPDHLMGPDTPPPEVYAAISNAVRQSLFNIHVPIILKFVVLLSKAANQNYFN